ncbi:MAG TPA: sialate O-acetylesterase, partial [Chitinophagales bacterium]|nr:sialate O-acetylesterase [Chitinophagales bacterium]
MPKKTSLLLLLWVISYKLFAQHTHLFLAAGQSNAVGVGNADSSVTCPAGFCYEYISWADSLRPLKDPVGYTSADEDFQAAVTGSLWPSFASAYHVATGDTIVIVQAAKGGTSCLAAADAGAGNWGPNYHL